MEENATQERELGTMPVGRLFMKYSLVSLGGMVAQIAMVVIEGIIMASGLGSHGLACVSVILSVELINLAVGGSLGIGVSAVVGSYLGEGDHERAQRAFGRGFWLTVYMALALTAAMELLAPQIVTLLGATPDIFDDAVAGIRGFVALFPLTILGQMLCSVLRVDEHPHAASMIQAGSSGIAIVFLALSTLVFGWGVPGAGFYYGLTIAPWSSALWFFVGTGRRQSSLRVRFSDMRLDAAEAAKMIKIGLPYFVLQMASSIYTAVVNNKLGELGDSMDLAAFAIINGYVIYVLALVVQALSYAVQAIASFNIGAKRYDRLIELIKKSLGIEIALMAVISLLICLFPEAVCNVFALGDTDLVAASAQPVRIVVALCSLGYTANIMSSYFECTDAVIKAVVCGCALYIIFTVPLINVFGALMGVEGVWWSQLAANVLTGVLAVVFAARECRRLAKKAA